MSFRPNTPATLRRLDGNNLFGEPSWSEPSDIQVGIVSLMGEAKKTSVRTDSSASRGNAMEDTVESVILFPALYRPRQGDRVLVHGFELAITGVQPRIAVNGRLDHYECKLVMWRE